MNPYQMPQFPPFMNNNIEERLLSIENQLNEIIKLLNNMTKTEH